MKTTIWLVVAIVVLIGAIAYAQGPAGSSMTITNAVVCPAPGLGVFSFCKPAAGGPVTFTDEGSAYAKVNLAGVAGPAGPAGPQGATGAVGPQGPAGSFSGPACITLTADTKGNLIITPVTCK